MSGAALSTSQSKPAFYRRNHGTQKGWGLYLISNLLHVQGWGLCAEDPTTGSVSLPHRGILPDPAAPRVRPSSSLGQNWPLRPRPPSGKNSFRRWDAPRAQKNAGNKVLRASRAVVSSHVPPRFPETLLSRPASRPGGRDSIAASWASAAGLGNCERQIRPRSVASQTYLQMADSSCNPT